MCSRRWTVCLVQSSAILPHSFQSVLAYTSNKYVPRGPWRAQHWKLILNKHVCGEKTLASHKMKFDAMRQISAECIQWYSICHIRYWLFIRLPVALKQCSQTISAGEMCALAVIAPRSAHHTSVNYATIQRTITIKRTIQTYKVQM